VPLDRPKVSRIVGIATNGRPSVNRVSWSGDRDTAGFTGGLKKVVIELGKSGLGAAGEKMLTEMAKKAVRAVE
jgi:hypothetical protein